MMILFTDFECKFNDEILIIFNCVYQIYVLDFYHFNFNIFYAIYAIKQYR